MRFLPLFVAASLLALLSNCTTTSRKPKPMTYDGRPLTGSTEYYRPGYRPTPLTAEVPTLRKGTKPGTRKTAKLTPRNATKPASSADEKPGPFSFFKRKDKGSSNSASGPPPAHGTHTNGTLYTNPDGTTSRIVDGAMIKSDGTKDWIIGNTIFHSNGTTSRIVGDTLINPDGSKSRRVQ